MKLKIIVAVGLAVGFITNANAISLISCQVGFDEDACSRATVQNRASNCSNKTTDCYVDNGVYKKIESCSACSYGQLCEKQYTLGCGDVPYKTCQSTCDSSSGGGDGEIGNCSLLMCLADQDTCVKVGQNCSGSTRCSAMNGTCVESCTACPTGYTLTSQQVTVSGCSSKLTFKTCVADCDGTCDNCFSSNWSTGTVYQSRTAATCNTSTCVCTKKTEYRCAGGYYGKPTNSISGCTICPDDGLSDAGINTAQTSCYITDGEDDTGVFTFDGGNLGLDRCYHN